MKKIIAIFLIILFFLLLGLLVKTYLDIEDAKVYIEFVMNSANNCLVKVEEMNRNLNEFQYNEEETQDIGELESSLEDLKRTYDDINSQKENYVIPYEAQGVDEELGRYLENVGNVISSYEGLLDAINNLEEKADFEDKLEIYIGNSNELQLEADQLEGELTEYVDSYTKFDLNRVINAIKSI
ncbi:hypothetical protein JW766_04845 [Candidatus Dojkabacteria bacterium]|nr:hypothetical protein [Candidatus Dojkabacteria bacterium]